MGQRGKIASKNALESYTYQIKQTVEDEKVKDKISEEDKKTILDKCSEIITWLDNNQTAEKEEFEHQQKELEAICNPIISKLYQQPGAAAPGTATPGEAGPTVEEVD